MEKTLREVSAVFPWPQFLTYVLVTAGTPGPNTLMSMGNGSRLGFRRALPFNFGIWAGFSVVMLLCAALCGALDALIPRLRLPMLVLGAAYMLYLAWHIWRAGPAEAREGRTGFVLTLCWSAFGSLLGRLFSGHARAVNRVMALLLVWCAVSLFL